MSLLSKLFSRRSKSRDKRNESSAITTVAVGGHGLSLAPVCPCSVAHLEDGTLVFQGFRGFEDSVATVKLGRKPAAKGKPVSGENHAEMTVFHFGRQGPSILLRGSARALDLLFVNIATGLGPAPWNLLSGGYWIDFPAGLAMVAPAPEDPNSHPELVLMSEGGRVSTDSIIRFVSVPKAIDEVEVDYPSGFQCTAEGELESEVGTVSWNEVEYSHDGRLWRRRYFFLPFSIETTVVMDVGAIVELSVSLFEKADSIASSYETV